MVVVRIPASTDATRITHIFTAGENIAAGQIVMVDSTETNTVLIGTAAGALRVCGVAITSATIGNDIEVCTYGIAEVTAGENLTASHLVGLGATAGRAYIKTAETSAAGSAHTHAETLGMGNPSSTGTEHGFPFGSPTKYVANSSGGSPTFLAYVAQSFDTISFGKDTHSHTISGAITNESAHTHGVNRGSVLGRMLDSVTTGNKANCLVCLG